MALADRHYMRDPYHPPRFAIKLIIVFIVAFVIQSVLGFYWRFDCMTHLGLTVAGIKGGEVWRLFTYQFLHQTPWPWHVLFNCLGLYFFGRPVEEILGPKRFLGLFFLSGVFGGLLHVLLTAVLPGHSDVYVVGASAGVCGMIAIFCTLHPMQELTTWIYFFPVNIRARFLLMFLSLLSLFGALVPFDNIAHAAHLGGIIVGISYVRWGDRFSRALAAFGSSKKQKPQLVRATTARSRPWKRSTPKPVPPEDFISKEVDPILDKISAKGIHSLTDEERKILEAARKKMGKR
jgi:membrane associated rhomboid family serine protease